MRLVPHRNFSEHFFMIAHVPYCANLLSEMLVLFLLFSFHFTILNSEHLFPSF